MGEVFLDSLLRAQLGFALRILAVLLATIGALPLIFALWPQIARWHLGPVGAGWLLVGVVSYPVLVLLGRAYIRRAEDNERAYAELLSPSPDPSPDLDPDAHDGPRNRSPR